MSELGAIKEALNDKMDRDLGNMGEMDYVVEWKTPTADDPTWYRKYKSGWVEQGGMTEKNSTGNTVTYLKAFKDEKYTLLLSIRDNRSAYAATYSSKTATGFVEAQYQSTFGSEWYACGQGA